MFSYILNFDTNLQTFNYYRAQPDADDHEGAGKTFKISAWLSV